MEERLTYVTASLADEAVVIIAAFISLALAAVTAIFAVRGILKLKAGRG